MSRYHPAFVLVTPTPFAIPAPAPAPVPTPAPAPLAATWSTDAVNGAHEEEAQPVAAPQALAIRTALDGSMRLSTQSIHMGYRLIGGSIIDGNFSATQTQTQTQAPMGLRRQAAFVIYNKYDCAGDGKQGRRA